MFAASLWEAPPKAVWGYTQFPCAAVARNLRLRPCWHAALLQQPMRQHVEHIFWRPCCCTQVVICCCCLQPTRLLRLCSSNLHLDVDSWVQLLVDAAFPISEPPLTNTDVNLPLHETKWREQVCRP